MPTNCRQILIFQSFINVVFTFFRLPRKPSAYFSERKYYKNTFENDVAMIEHCTGFIEVVRNSLDFAQFYRENKEEDRMKFVQ